MAIELRKLPILEGVRPFKRSAVPTDLIAGVTLAALAIPEVMGYSTIAGMPVVTGLYTLVLPAAVYALLGSSRHLVVGADSATAAVMAAGLSGLAATGSSQYVALAGMMALLAGGILLLFRIARLGFIADFLSRTVLVGFLTGVGIQVAMGQVGGILGVPSGTGGTLSKFWGTLENIGDTSLTTLAVALSVIAVILGMKRITTKVPGALIAVIGAIAVSWAADLAAHGVATLGPVQGGLPSVGWPEGVTKSEVTTMLATAVSIAVLMLAQSAATSRAYAAKYNESFDENTDLVGLTAASAAAGLSGAYVVNGSPTKTEMVDGAGGRSQVALLTMALVVVVVLLFLTGPLQYLPNAVLSAVVFLIGVELVDFSGMAKILRVRSDEFVVATLVAATVVVVGVEQGIVLAILASAVDHIRRSYRPPNTVITEGRDGNLRLQRSTPQARTEDGLVVYHFSAELYYANANHLLEEVGAILSAEPPVRWFCLDAVAMADVDYTGGQVISQIHTSCRDKGVRLVLVRVEPDVLDQLRRYGTIDELGDGALYDTIPEVIAAFEQAAPGT